MRQTKIDYWQHTLVSDIPASAVYLEIKDGSSIFPLYLYPNGHLLLDDQDKRKALYDRFVLSQKFAQVDPWAERVAGLDAHEFTPLADLSIKEAAE